jgi:RNA polymerase sigma-70 factor (ECF subfamily)
VDGAKTDSAENENQTVSERSSESSFIDIFLAESGRLRRIIAGMGLGAFDAEDILQNVSIKAAGKIEKCRDSAQAVRWLIKVTVNLCLMEHRRQKRFSRKTPEIIESQSQGKVLPRGTDEEAIEAEELEIVRETLRGLDSSLLGPVVLRYFCGINSKEVGEILNLNPSTVRSRLREGRMLLAKRLLERGIER